MGYRRKARELALQTLYSFEFDEIDETIGVIEFLNTYSDKLKEIVENSESHINSAIIEFAESLIKKVIINRDTLDENIEKYLRNWKLERIPSVDKEILRIAIAEMLFSKAPHPVIINEAIDIAKRYSAENSTKFVNGILDSISKEIKNAKNTD